MLKVEKDRVAVIRKDRPLAVVTFIACLMLSLFVMYAFGHLGWLPRLLSCGLFIVVILSVPRHIPGDVIFDKAAQTVEVCLWKREKRIPFVDVAAIRPASYCRDTGEFLTDDSEESIASKGVAYCLFTKSEPYFDCTQITNFIKDGRALDDLRRGCFREAEGGAEISPASSGIMEHVFGKRDGMLVRRVTPEGHYWMALLSVPLAMTFGAMLYAAYLKTCPYGWCVFIPLIPIYILVRRYVLCMERLNILDPARGNIAFTWGMFGKQSKTFSFDDVEKVVVNVRKPFLFRRFDFTLRMKFKDDDRLYKIGSGKGPAVSGLLRSYAEILGSGLYRKIAYTLW